MPRRKLENDGDGGREVEAEAEKGTTTRQRAVFIISGRTGVVTIKIKCHQLSNESTKAATVERRSHGLMRCGIRSFCAA